MNPKHIISVVLLAFVGVSVAYMVVNRPGDSPPPAETPATGPAGAKVIAYYFHRNKRCDACNKIEKWTRQTVHTSFADALADGRLEWKIVNFQTPGNEHFKDAFKLHTQTVIIAEVKGGKTVRFEPMPLVWQMLNNQPGFEEYIREGVNEALVRLGES